MSDFFGTCHAVLCSQINTQIFGVHFNQRKMVWNGEGGSKMTAFRDIGRQIGRHVAIIIGMCSVIVFFGGFGIM